LRVVAKINLGPVNAGDTEAAGLLDPAVARRNSWEQLPLAEHRRAMMSWARYEALPMLALVSTETESPAGLQRYAGKILALPPDGPIDVAALTDRSDEYWKALYECHPGDPVVPMFRIALLASQGEHGKAGRYVGAIRRLVNLRTPARLVLEEYWEQVNAYMIRLGAKSNEIGRLLESHRYDDARKAAAAQLAVAPEHVWVRWLMFQIDLTQAIEENGDSDAVRRTWPEVRRTLYSADPLIPIKIPRGQGDDEERFQLARGADYRKILQKKPRFTPEDLGEMVDVYSDVGMTGLAAETAWIVGEIHPIEGRSDEYWETVFISNLNKLGIHSLDHIVRLKKQRYLQRIKAEQEKRRKAVKDAAQVAKDLQKAGTPKP
jgi:hypothetical protein